MWEMKREAQIIIFCIRYYTLLSWDVYTAEKGGKRQKEKTIRSEVDASKNGDSVS